MFSELLMNFLQAVIYHDIDINPNEIMLLSFLHSILSNPSVYTSAYIDLKKPSDNDYGLFEIGDFRVQICCIKNENDGFDHYELIIADNSDGKKKRMAVLTANRIESELIEMDSSGMKENEIIDLNEEGRRWEGGELNGKPFGFGCEYSEEGNLVYEGFVFEGKKVCFGKEWNDDGNNNCLMYEGGYYNDKRCGNGISYDLNGNVDFDGEWMNNHGMTENENDLMNNLIVPMSVEEFVIDDEMFNDENITSLHFFPLLVRLKRIEIGNECFKHIREFVIDGLERLESVKIGGDCFRISENERNNGICRITNCPNLRQLEIGNGSFEDFKSFELSNVNSLQSINFGNECFRLAKELSLKGE